MAPNVATVFSGLVMQSLGRVAYAGSPMMWTWTLAAVSMETGNVMSAVASEPQASPSANRRHSASGFVPSVCGGSVMAGAVVRTDDTIRSPTEPVSTSM